MCLICLEPIPADAAIWACRASCHCCLHLLCAQAWARQQLQAAVGRAQRSIDNPDLCARPAPAVQHAQA